MYTPVMAMHAPAVLLSLLAVATAQVTAPAPAPGDVPAGVSTRDVARDKVGSVPYGVTITSCTTPGVVALTFDDGPSTLTPELLDLLDSLDNATATFFMAGDNGQPGGMDNCAQGYGDTVKRIYNSRHQIGHHTWDHPSLNSFADDAAGQEGFEKEMIYNEMAFRNIIGVLPTYMRPPYLECDPLCERRLNDLGYHIISVDLDTNDWNYTTVENNINAQNNFKNGIDARSAAAGNSALVLAHDIHATTVQILAKIMVTYAREKGFRLVTVGECLGDPRENWYRKANGDVLDCHKTSSTSSSSGSGSSGSSGNTPRAAYPAGSCGPKYGNGLCVSGSCCSQYGFCGFDTPYCGAGCQSSFGDCYNNTTPAPAPAPVPAPAPAPAPAPGPFPEGSCGALAGGRSCATGNCCSKDNFCGTTDAYCGAGCQSNFGRCNPS